MEEDDIAEDERVVRIVYEMMYWSFEVLL